MKTLAIIPARSGSKGLKDKNILEICGKPLLHYTLEAAVNSGIFDEIMVSTDSASYAEIAQKVTGVKVPFLRSKDTSHDTASTWSVVQEVLQNYHEAGQDFDMFCILQPTSPLRTSVDIQKAFALYQQNQANSVVSVCELGHPLNICNTLPDDHSLVGFIQNPQKSSRQMNPTAYRLNGAIYICNTKNFLNICSVAFCSITYKHFRSIKINSILFIIIFNNCFG